LAGGQAIVGMDFEALATQEAERLQAVSLRPAVNLSGVILHTGLGRARLAPSAAAAVAQVAASHSTLEFDLESGERGERQDHVRGLLRKLTGAEDALVVNNAAAGVVLALSALAQGREVILSRGQMVEIGGSFRMPEIVKQSGCQLVEVGCTNKTHLSDYKKAFSEETAAILRCHPSNFQIVGFTEQPPLSDLVALASEHGALCIDDMGTGCLVDTTAFGLPKQTTIPEAVAAGAHLVIASGDKLLGGPQAGIILGKAELVQQLKSHPLARALRADKLCLAALEATLRLYSTGREMEIPCLGYLARPLAQVKRAAQQLARAYPGMARIKPTTTQVGGGCAPGAGVPSFAAVLQTEKAADLAARLRAHRPPIVGRVQDGAVWLDPRTAEADEVRLVAKALKELGS
jgi:L-seryl-tRNA(Ser) seleniumtransferase